MIFVSVALANSPWVEKAGEARFALGYSGLSTETQFAAGDSLGLIGDRCPEPVGPGDRGPYSCELGGRFSMHSLFPQASVALDEHITVDATIPVVVGASFADDIGTERVRGLGDTWLGVRAGARPDGWAASGMLRTKLPTGRRLTGERDVPIGEGQVDVELSGLVGASLWPWGWVEGQQGFRLRFKEAGTGIDPGDEWIGYAGGGLTPTKWLALTAKLEWMIATADHDDFDTSSPGRKAVQVRTGLGLMKTDRVWVGADVAVPLWGQRWPAGPIVSVSVAGRPFTAD